MSVSVYFLCFVATFTLPLFFKNSFCTFCTPSILSSLFLCIFFDVDVVLIYLFPHVVCYCVSDIDECSLGVAVHGCGMRCVDTDGSYSCVCPAGYVIHTDGKTCIGKTDLASYRYLWLNCYCQMSFDIYHTL